MSQETVKQADEKKPNNGENGNHHYITESFVKSRFGDDKGFVRLYHVKYGTWKPNASPQFVFSGPGYTQLLIEGMPIDNKLEGLFSKVENNLKYILPALDYAADRQSTLLDEEIYRNLCVYCAYLHHLSPYAKAKAPVDYVYQLNGDLAHGNTNHLRDMQISEENIAAIQHLHANGRKIYINGRNYLQWTFRTQFARNVNYTAKLYQDNIRWTVYNSPIELPISDIALVDYPEKGNAASLYIFPISPYRVLIGRLEYGSPPPLYKDTMINGATLTIQSAEDILDIICLSGIKAIACKNKMEIGAFRERAIKKQIKFQRMAIDIDAVLKAGSVIFNPDTDFRLWHASSEDFVKYVHGFILPPIK